MTIPADGSSLWLGGSGPEGGRVVRVDLEAGRVDWSADVPDQVVGMDFSVFVGVVFAAGGGDGADETGRVTRVDSATGKVLGTVEPDGSPYGVAAAPGGVWVTDAGSDRVWRLDPEAGTVAATVRVAGRPTGVAFTWTGRNLFVASPAAGIVTRLDADTGAVRGTTAVGTANGVVATASAVWVGGSSMVRLDPATGAEVGKIPTPGVTTVQSVSDGWVWGHAIRGALVRGTADELQLDPRPIANGEFVVAATLGDRLFVSDPDRNRIVEYELPLPSDLDFPGEQTGNGANFGFIRGLDGDELIFDPAEDLHSPEATQVAVRDGVEITEAEGLPNDYYDRNRDGDTVRLPLAPDAELILLRHPGTVDRATFRRALEATTSEEFFGHAGSVPFQLTVEDGVVVRVERQYRP